MSPTELLVLTKGRVPAPIVLSEIETWLSAQDEDGALDVLSEKSNVSTAALRSWLEGDRGQRDGIAFDDADRLFIAMGRVHLWTTRYIDYYLACDLRWTRCACPGCEIMFDGSHAQEGPTMKLYCSKACQTAAAKIREGVTSRRHKRYLDPTVCRNGHPKTEENTKRRPDGREECRVCSRDTAKRCYEKKMGRAA